MNIRELLQYEIWNKRTTRKILVGFGLFVASVFLGIWAWTEFELHWLTSGERNAAKAALHQIDLLDSPEPLGDPDFNARRGQARAKVDAAQAAARTYRDGLTVVDLNGYLVKAVIDQERIRGRLKAAQDRRLERDLFGDIRTKLHKELD